MKEIDKLKETLEEIHKLAEKSVLYLPKLESLDHEEKEPLVELYTGLKDKNGKEIYVGDILMNILGLVYIVSFDNGFTKMTSLDGSYGALVQQYIDETEVHIIGNIHENPELMEGEK